jgi:hypothetical protein
MVAALVGVGLIGLALGAVGRSLLPRPRRAGVLAAMLAGLVGGEVGVLASWAARTRVEYAWIAGILAAAAGVGIACGLIGLRNGPFPPHETTPRRVDPAERTSPPR